MHDMNTYYKVVRPSLRSFADPTFAYKIGGTRIARRPAEGGRVFCGPPGGYLHASATPSHAARYGRWPYRLLAVEGVPEVHGNDKYGFLRLKVLAELPVERCFGSNGAAVLAVIKQAETMTWEHVHRLVAVVNTLPTSTAGIAWTAIRDTVASRAAWAAAVDAAGAVGAARAIVGDTAAALALIGDHHYGITQEDINTITAPWRYVFGDTAAGDTAAGEPEKRESYDYV